MPGSFGPLAECRPGMKIMIMSPQPGLESWICLVSHRWRGGLKSGARVAG
jgi:hypothetical protein